MDIDSYMGKPNYVSIVSVNLFCQSTVMYVCQSEQHSMMSVIVTDSVSYLGDRILVPQSTLYRVVRPAQS